VPLTEFLRRFDPPPPRTTWSPSNGSFRLPACSVAETFAISKKTVKHHLTNIFSKVGVSNRLELALVAVHHDSDSPTL
jgi:hypothetical protein